MSNIYDENDYPHNLIIENTDVEGRIKVTFSSVSDAIFYKLSLRISYRDRDIHQNFDVTISTLECNGFDGSARNKYEYGEKVMFEGNVYDFGYNSAKLGYVVIYYEGENNMQ